MYIWLTVTVVSVAVMLLAMAVNRNAVSGVVKMVASTGFMALAVAGGALDSWYGILVLISLGFSWWGDLFLIFTQKTLFLLGLIVFFLSHIGYCAAFLVHGVDVTFAVVFGLALIVPFLVLLHWLKPNLKDMAIPVYAYMVVISIMVALAFGAMGEVPEHRLMPIAAVLFYVSDVFVARDRFVKPGKDNRYMGLPLYYAGQVLFAWTVSLTVS
jgi:uncharacterized membrane protein YhhN